jgi:hypothetical protein
MAGYIQGSTRNRGFVVMAASNLRNFNLTVEEIKIVRMMNELSTGLEKLVFDDPLSPRADFFRQEIEKLEQKLEDIRESTLIR